MYNLRSRNIRVTLQDSSSSTTVVVKMSKHVKARQKKKENENGVGNSIGNNKELYTIDYVLHEAVIPLFFLDIDDETS
jgi:hypothetical protein